MSRTRCTEPREDGSRCQRTARKGEALCGPCAKRVLPDGAMRAVTLQPGALDEEIAKLDAEIARDLAQFDKPDPKPAKKKRARKPKAEPVYVEPPRLVGLDLAAAQVALAREYSETEREDWRDQAIEMQLVRAVEALLAYGLDVEARVSFAADEPASPAYVEGGDVARASAYDQLDEAGRVEHHLGAMRDHEAALVAAYEAEPENVVAWQWRISCVEGHAARAFAALVEWLAALPEPASIESALDHEEDARGEEPAFAPPRRFASPQQLALGGFA